MHTIHLLISVTGGVLCGAFVGRRVQNTKLEAIGPLLALGAGAAFLGLFNLVWPQ